jgi:hypothetical protein
MRVLPGPDAYHVLRQVGTGGRPTWFMNVVAAGATRCMLTLLMDTCYLFIFFIESMVKDGCVHIINYVNTMEDIRNILTRIEVGLDNIELTLSEFAPVKSE